MAKDRRKIEKKRKKEYTKQRVQQAYREQARLLHAKISKYPEVIFDESEGDPEFIALIKNTQAAIDLDDPADCDDTIRGFYTMIRRFGIDKYDNDIAMVRAEGEETASKVGLMDFAFRMHYGTVLFNKIPEEVRKKFLPYNDVFIGFVGNNLLFLFSSLLKTKGVGGTIYHSRKQPTMTLDEEILKVGFSRHAIEQAVVRLNPNYLQYAASGDVHAFFANCTYHEPVTLDSRLHPNQPAFCMYGSCDDPSFKAYEVYVDDIFGLNGATPDYSRGNFYYRLGYFPVERDNGFAKAVTFIRPGYTGTPELDLLQRRTDLPRQEKAFLLREARENKGREALLEGRTEVIKWFHDNGVAQVVQFPHPLFEDNAAALTTPLQKVSHAAKVKAAMQGLSRKDLKTRIRKSSR